ncbi:MULTISPECIES: TetR/AcrR family transcriptional regulator [unclassified Gordonia (in: high G+C Gram-positive bacteria)]|uniref:TetR/AcrR family transcriptional regulator n=1 Tax=unclassified Gordonia (in: high G+C Gram-positive bacteria) TaxID=2657482 RepID=UPI001FFE9533|nr:MULTISPECIES: TetR/AcrR family transcriptional regulator C-terminal domain-containing protein [unclassified Gordonia (in: high G+C Gram-positive bacteria)]UQE73486.1 TetR/AcrR family transcriptional regulator C-terminal domain-containing protein [Gordonia sp. PP30]
MAESADDVRRIVDLLWGAARADETPAPRPGPRQRSSVREVVAAAIGIADAHGLAELSMRTLAARVGLRPMGLYTYVPNREVLLALMVDAVAAEDGPIRAETGLAECLRAVAGQYRDELLAHPWLLGVPAWRPVPGPGSSRRYERQLVAITEAAAREGMVFGDVELDAVVAALRAFAMGNARSRIDQRAAHRDSGMTDAQWWAVAGPRLAESMPAGDYPVSSRVGSVVGELFAGPGDADHAYEFGLGRLIDGIVAGARRSAETGPE